MLIVLVAPWNSSCHSFSGCDVMDRSRDKLIISDRPIRANFGSKSTFSQSVNVRFSNTGSPS
jgi:hypothetical protein